MTKPDSVISVVAPKGPVLLRDQRRALYAYKAVADVQPCDRKNYKIAINDLGSNVLKTGLAAAIAAIERMGDRGTVLLRHLTSADLPGLEGATEKTFAGHVRELDVDQYILATREMLRVATWLKRAAQATFGDL